MLSEVFPFLIDLISKCANWLFTLVINENPRITLGTFILACAFIGVVIYFIFGTDFFPGHINIGSNSAKYNNDTDNYKPKHSQGNTKTYSSNYSTREGRNK